MIDNTSVPCTPSLSEAANQAISWMMSEQASQMECGAARAAIAEVFGSKVDEELKAFFCTHANENAESEPDPSVHCVYIAPPIRTLEQMRTSVANWEGAMYYSTTSEDVEEVKRADAAMRMEELRMAECRHLFLFDQEGDVVGLKPIPNP